MRQILHFLCLWKNNIAFTAYVYPINQNEQNEAKPVNRFKSVLNMVLDDGAQCSMFNRV